MSSRKRRCIRAVVGAASLAGALATASLSLAQAPRNPADPQSGFDDGSMTYGAPYQPNLGSNQSYPGYAGPGQNFMPGPPPPASQGIRPSSWVGGAAASAANAQQNQPPGQPPLSGQQPRVTNASASGIAGRAMNIGASGAPGPLTASPQSPHFAPGMAPATGAASAAAMAAPVTAPENAYDAPLAPSHDEFNGTEIIAWVGHECILSGDLLPAINEVIEANKAQIPPDQVDDVRRKMIQERLRPLIETKLIYSDAMRKLPKDNVPKIRDQVDKMFMEHNAPAMMEAYKVKTVGLLEEKLRQGGTSLENQKQQFFERSVASQFVHQQVKDEFEITHEQMLEYYYAHLKEYESPPRARWEQLRVRFDKHETKEEAWQLLATWGNALLKGASLSELAKAHSEDPSASEGGRHDWSIKDSLASKELDAAIFTLPVGAPSRIIEDDRGLSIVRVVEREDLTRKPFPETQVEIRKKIKEARIETEMESYIVRLRARTPVRTIFDTPTLSPLANRAPSPFK